MSGSAPLVDVASTTTTTQLTRETLELLPTSRNSFNAMMIPNTECRTSVRLDVGGSGFNDSPRFHTMGQLGESWQGVEDIIMQGPASNPSGSYVDYSTLEEATVQVMLAPPRRHGGWRSTASSRAAATIFTDRAITHGPPATSNRTTSRRSCCSKGISEGDKLRLRDDFSGELGGRLVRDKLWFFVSSASVASTTTSWAASSPWTTGIPTVPSPLTRVLPSDRLGLSRQRSRCS